MTCPDCEAASKGMHHGFSAECTGCAARAIARDPAYFESRKYGYQTERYRCLLRAMKVTHEQVKAADAKRV